jgi:hypothetical protein
MGVSQQDPRLISFNTLRKSIGWLSILMPPAMLAGNYLLGDCSYVQESLSDYYYTITGNLLVGMLCAMALFLISYKGYPGDRLDGWLTTIAGLLALGAAFIPTNAPLLNGCAVIHLPWNDTRSLVHNLLASLLFIDLALISLVLFTKGRLQPTMQKQKRNRVYKICGYIILTVIALVPIYNRLVKINPEWGAYKLVFWLEWIAMTAFGFSWLVKGGLFLRDQPKE